MRWIVSSAVLVLFAWWCTGEEPEALVGEGAPQVDEVVRVRASDVVRTESRDEGHEDRGEGRERSDHASATAQPVVPAIARADAPGGAPHALVADADAEEEIRDASVDASPEVAYAIAENARRTVAYDSYDDELLSFYRHELELTDEDLEILADATQRMAAQTSGQVVPRPDEGEVYGNYQAILARYRAEVRAHLGEDRFTRVVEFQRTFTTAAPDRFGTEQGVPFERF